MDWWVVSSSKYLRTFVPSLWAKLVFFGTAECASLSTCRHDEMDVSSLIPMQYGIHFDGARISSPLPNSSNVTAFLSHSSLVALATISATKVWSVPTRCKYLKQRVRYHFLHHHRRP